MTQKAIDNRTMLIFADLLFRWQTRLKLIINFRTKLTSKNKFIEVRDRNM